MIIADAVLEYQGKRYTIEQEFPDFADEEAIDYLFTDGNYACDCTRSLFIREQCDPEFPELPCGGDEIELVELNFTII